MNPLNLILASASPRRRRFLEELGLPHTVITADIDETQKRGEDPLALVRRLAETKARSIAEGISAAMRPALIIGADTVVVSEGRVLGKPEDEDEAIAMLVQLRQHSHHVHSALALVRVDNDGTQQSQIRVNSTVVTMRHYSNEEIVEYVATGDPLDKAGAYAIQHRSFAPVRALHGCPAGVMGLPLADLRDLLAEQGITVSTPLPPICAHLIGLPCCQLQSGDTVDSPQPR